MRFLNYSKTLLWSNYLNVVTFAPCHCNCHVPRFALFAKPVALAKISWPNPLLGEPVGFDSLSMTSLFAESWWAALRMWAFHSSSLGRAVSTSCMISSLRSLPLENKRTQKTHLTKEYNANKNRNENYNKPTIPHLWMTAGDDNDICRSTTAFR